MYNIFIYLCIIYIYTYNIYIYLYMIYMYMILLMAEILHQLIGSLSHYLQGLYIPGGAGFLPSTVDMIHQVYVLI